MRKKYLVLVLLLFCVCLGMRAQTFSLITGREPIASLDGLWRFHTGDNPAWADPKFDDSRWPLLRSDRDWSGQGYKGYSGMVWYRFTVQAPEGGKPLSLLLPDFTTSYQVFADGRLQGGCGAMPPHPVAHFCYTRVIALGRRSLSGPGTIVVAIRVWHWPVWAGYYGGGPRGTSYVGAPTLIQRQLQASLDRSSAFLVQYYFLVVFACLGAVVSFALFLFRPGNREYVWFGALLLMMAIEAAMQVGFQFYSGAILNFFAWDDLVLSLAWFASLGFYNVLLRGRRAWPLYIALAAVSLYLLQHLLLSFSTTTLHMSAGLFNIVANALLIPPILWILVLLTQRAREKQLDARLLLLPAFLLYGNILTGGLFFATFQLGWQHRYAYDTFSVLSRPFPLDSDVLTKVIFLVAMVAILVNRFARTSREEERYAGEMEAARGVQSLLVPATAPSTPGFAVESVYLPASEVGGDFFHVQPGEDGSLLIVMGDVSGKGLKAAMTVSVIVGALRNEKERRPAQVLSNLNRVLHGQVSGFVTCSAARIAADGAMTFANAGHLAPYLNGAELAVAGDLPLGIDAEGSYAESQYQLASGDRLTFVSDGVVEATNEMRELFGFERTQAISKQPAGFIAETAKSFGQEDDISVLSVQLLQASPA